MHNVRVFFPFFFKKKKQKKNVFLRKEISLFSSWVEQAVGSQSKT